MLKPSLAASLLLSAAAAAAQTAPPGQAANETAGLPQPLLGGRHGGAAAQDVPAFLWWAGPQERDALGPGTLAQGFRAAPGLWAAPAPGDGTGLIAVRHGRSRPGLVLAGAPLPVPLALPLFDVDLLLAEGAAPDAAPGAAGAAGTLAIDLVRPDDRLAGMGEFAAGAFGSRRWNGRIDLPLTRGIRVGLAGLVHHDLGWLANSTIGERLNRGQRTGLAGLIDIDLTPRLAWQISLVHAGSRAGNLPGFTCDPNAPTRCGGRYASTGQRGTVASDGGPLDAGWGAIGADLAGQPLGQRADLALAASTLAWAAGPVTLTLSQSLARQTGRRGLDLADGRRLDDLATPAGLASGGYGLIGRSRDRLERRQISADGRWGALHLQVGGAVQHQLQWRRQADTEAGTVLADRELEQRHRTHSLFGTARFTPREGLELIASARWTEAQLRLAVTDLRPGCAPCLAPADASLQRRQFFTPEFALGWRPAAVPALLLFARSARTARLPGWNLLARETAALSALPAETGWHHEAGAKADLADGRLRLDAALFTARTRGAVPTLLDIDPLAVIAAQDMQARGLNAAMVARPVAQLELAGSLALQRVRWRGAVPAGLPARPLFAPDAAASLSAAWRQPLPGTGANLVPRLALDWRSAMAVAAGDVVSADGRGLLVGGMAPGGWQVAAALQMEIPDGGWLMSLECSNCLDRALVDGAVAGLPVLNAPRWWQIRFVRRF